MTNVLGKTKKANLQHVPVKPIYVSTCNKLSDSEVEALGLSEERLQFLMDWYAEFGKSRLNENDKRRDECNYIVIAEDSMMRFEVWHRMEKSEGFENSIDSVVTVVEELGDDYWTEEK